jgi:acyl carrier protein
MDMMLEQIAAIVTTVRPSAGVLEEDTALIDQLGFTSLDVMNLILALERRFAITFRDEDLDLDRFVTIGAVVTTLRAYDVATV